MKANTVEQYHILKWLRENFYLWALEVSFLDHCTVQISDEYGQEAIVTYKNGKVELN